MKTLIAIWMTAILSCLFFIAYVDYSINQMLEEQNSNGLTCVYNCERFEEAKRTLR